MTAIAVTGATGQVGTALVKLLQKNHIKNKLLTRDLSKVDQLLHPSSNPVYFDFSKPETYENALKGVRRLFLVCTFYDEMNMMHFFNAVKEASIPQIVFMSGMGSGNKKEHYLARIEHLLEFSKIPYVSLRANWFFQNFATLFQAMIVENRELTFPDGKASISFVDTRDIAEVALHFLTEPVNQENLVLQITGPESLTHADVAKLFSKHLSYSVGYRELSEQDAINELGWGDNLLSLFKDIRHGLTAPVSKTVKQILGKPARKFEDYIVENKSLWNKDFNDFG